MEKDVAAFYERGVNGRDRGSARDDWGERTASPSGRWTHLPDGWRVGQLNV